MQSKKEKLCQISSILSKIILELTLQFKRRLFKIRVVSSSNLHWDRFDLDQCVVFGPCAPLNSRGKWFSREAIDAIQIGKSTLVEPPSSVVTEVTTALHRPAIKEARRVTPIVVNIHCAERHWVLIIFFSEAPKCITWVKQTF